MFFVMLFFFFVFFMNSLFLVFLFVMFFFFLFYFLDISALVSKVGHEFVIIDIVKSIEIFRCQSFEFIEFILQFLHLF